MRRRSGVQNGDHGTQDSPPLDEAGLKEAYLKSRRRKVSKRFVDSPRISIETHHLEMVSKIVGWQTLKKRLIKEV